MKLRIFQVDAFTDHVFGGNPAAVVPLKEWLPDGVMQKIAAENNLSETAFVVPRSSGHEIRWFTPVAEIDLCGHATLAAAYVLFTHLGYKEDEVAFLSKSGGLKVAMSGDLLSLDFPARRLVTMPATELAERAFGAKPSEMYLADQTLAVFDSEETIRAMKPDLEMLRQLPGIGVVVTARGEDVDFVSRAFFPKFGIPEDPVTGATHCALVPYWSARLNKKSLTARQLSARGGQLYLEDCADRVRISGKAVLYLEGAIYV